MPYSGRSWTTSCGRVLPAAARGWGQLIGAFRLFTPTAPSRYIIKQQPQPGCLSTLEAVHELMLVLEKNGLDRYEQPAQLHGIFDRMQRFQMECAADPNRGGYRRQAYSNPSERTKSRGERGNRRDDYLKIAPVAAGAVIGSPPASTSG